MVPAPAIDCCPATTSRPRPVAAAAATAEEVDFPRLRVASGQMSTDLTTTIMDTFILNNFYFVVSGLLDYWSGWLDCWSFLAGWTVRLFCLFGLLAGWTVGRFWLVGPLVWLVGLLACWTVGLAGWLFLAGWTVGRWVVGLV